MTGLGVVSPVGNDVESFWASLIAGRSGITQVTRFDASDFRTRIAAEVKDFDALAYMDRKEIRRTDLYVQYAIAASAQALGDSGLNLASEDATRIGVIIGTGIGGIATFEEQTELMLAKGPSRVSPFFIPMMIANMASGQVSIQFGLKGPNTTTVSACASGAHAIGEAFQAIKSDQADIMVTGGSEATITKMAMAGFCALKAMSTRNDEPMRASRPFERDRDGFVMGEGAGVLVLEEYEHARARGANILAEMVGYGSTGDAYHITAPPPEGEGAARAMAMALKEAGLKPADVDYINAHGTSTDLNDKYETAAVKTVFGEDARRLAISSTKSMTGHLLGAAGGVEAVATVLTISRELLPPTVNFENRDPDCDLDYVPNEARPATVRAALSNSFGFGGHNVSLAIRRADR
ncbi:MAG: 3-oxoacyl-acyl-carrier-protein synthase II [bacterium]|nr:MAG: 3-oxoacyl-acyl-carrier-protein synthase II [bacterium]